MTVVVVLADGFEEIEAVTPIDLLRRAGVTVVTAGLAGTEAVGARGLRIVCDTSLDAAPTANVLVFPGGQPGSRHLGASALVQQRIQETLAAQGTIAAICAAPAAVLGAHGHLAGRRFTGYPGTEASVVDGIAVAEAVVEDGPFVTSRGVGTAAAFGLALVRRLAGAEAADQVARAALLA